MKTEEPLAKQRAASRRSYWKNLEKNKLRMKLWRDKNKEIAASLTKAWLALNSNYHKEWRSRNRDKMAEADKKWSAKNPDKIRVKASNRRAKIRRAGGSHTVEDLARISYDQKGRCAYCRIKFRGREYHVDHIIPLSAGGSSAPGNIQLLCRRCNLSKGPRDPIAFAQSIGFLI